MHSTRLEHTAQVKYTRWILLVKENGQSRVRLHIVFIPFMFIKTCSIYFLVMGAINLVLKNHVQNVRNVTAVLQISTVI